MQCSVQKILSLLMSVCAVCAYAVPYPFCTPQFATQTDIALKKIYAQPLPQQVTQRIRYFSQLWLNQPYELTALGEGMQGQFDQAPLYRVDAFDCQTYVETVLAFAIADSAQQFKQCISMIRYAQGNIHYTQRHHFTSPDWNAYNQRSGLLQDITPTFVDRYQHRIARYADAEIDPANWYQHFDRSKIRLCHGTPDLISSRLHRLQEQGSKLAKKRSHIAYIPIHALIKQDQNSQDILNQIPDGAIVEIVRPNWDLTQQIGTHLNVSHIGFVLREQGDLYFYNASSLVGKVYKISLVDYLISMSSIPSIQGINVQIILPTHPGSCANTQSKL